MTAKAVHHCGDSLRGDAFKGTAYDYVNKERGSHEDQII
jgi:hypothetical protein